MPEGPVVEKLNGRVRQLQLERTRGGGVVICGVAPADGGELIRLIVPFRDTDGVMRSQFDLLRDALLNDLAVRLAYSSVSEADRHDLRAVRLYASGTQS